MSSARKYQSVNNIGKYSSLSAPMRCLNYLLLSEWMSNYESAASKFRDNSSRRVDPFLKWRKI